jgi:hypothetical protein
VVSAAAGIMGIKHNKLLHPTHAAPRFLCISLRFILSTKTALQHVRLSKALCF